MFVVASESAPAAQSGRGEIKKAESGEADSASRREGGEPFTLSIAAPSVKM
jgi:hypothetical protein